MMTLSSEPIPTMQIVSLIDRIQADLERLRGLVQPKNIDFDPKDPRNKTADGKLTPRGIEVCYRLFDMGKTRYAVKEAMDISFGGATHRLDAWKKAGGTEREKHSLESFD